MASKYIDVGATLQVIGSILKTPSLLEQEEKYWFIENDFPNEFHRVVFGTVYQLFQLGTKQISIDSIIDYLSSRPHNKAIFLSNNGEEFLLKVAEAAQPASFNYYYNRLKKMTLLRAYDDIGFDVSYLYDADNILDTKKKEQQENWLDNTSLEEIANTIDLKISQIRDVYVNDDYSEVKHASKGLTSLVEKFKQNPEIGIPMYGPLINTVTRGARLTKFYLRSAPSGYGKTRANVADACYFACDWIYDEHFGWIKNGTKNPTLFIATEQNLDEIQTLMLAFIANVNEAHILDGEYEPGEEERIQRAIQVLSEAPLYVKECPDFSIKDIENTIKKEIKEHNVSYVVFDYLQTSMKILEEITRRSGGVRLREDNILFMFSSKLKDLCNLYGVFILTGTQLSADWRESKTPDQNLLRGAKSIADKIDYGCHILPVSDEDLKALSSILGNFPKAPNNKISIYKNRRGAYKGIYLWSYADLGTCRIKPMFATDWSYNLISIDDVRVEIASEDDGPSAF